MNGKDIALIKALSGGSSGGSGGGIPSGGTPYQQLVTDGDGNARWEDRLAYVAEPVETVFLEETTANFMDVGGMYICDAPPFFDPSVGETYNIVWDGAVYQCVCLDLEGKPVLGNLSVIDAGDDSEEPFVILINAASIILATKDTSLSHTISVAGHVTPIVKIPAKFIDKDSSGYIVIHDNATMTPLEVEKYNNALYKNEVVFIIWGGLCVQAYGIQSQNGVSQLTVKLQNGESYTINENDDGLFDVSDRKFSYASLPGKPETGDDSPKIAVDENKVRILPGTVHPGVGSTDILFHVGANGTKSKGFNVLGNGEAVTPALILYSSTEGSTKQFRITVDDTGTISATEVT